MEKGKRIAIIDGGMIGHERFVHERIIDLSKDIAPPILHIIEKENLYEQRNKFSQYNMRFTQKRTILNGYTFDKFIQEKDRVLAKESKLSANDRKEVMDCWEYMIKENIK